jgi:hypothetical protein
MTINSIDKTLNEQLKAAFLEKQQIRRERAIRIFREGPPRSYFSKEFLFQYDNMTNIEKIINNWPLEILEF